MEVQGPRKPKARGPWTGGSSGLNKNRRYADLEKRGDTRVSKTGGKWPQNDDEGTWSLKIKGFLRNERLCHRLGYHAGYEDPSRWHAM